MLSNCDKIKRLGVFRLDSMYTMLCTLKSNLSKQESLMPLGVDHYSFNLKSLLPKWLLTFDAVRRLDHLGFYEAKQNLMYSFKLNACYHQNRKKLLSSERQSNSFKHY